MRWDESFEQLAAGYFDDTLDRAEQLRLAEMLRGDDALVARLAELAQTHQMIRSEITYQQQASRFDLTRTPSDTAAALAMLELADQMDGGIADPIDFAAWQLIQREQGRQDQKKAMRNRLLVGISIASAFVLLVGVVLNFVRSVDHASPPHATTSTSPHKPAASQGPTSPEPTPVATLTAEHGAVWAEGALSPGSPLRAGQRMTLTQGFAEITTARGAVAIIEAPAIIELIDNDNAIRLKSGKMVGICEVPTSQGFVVRTPHMDVTDLGTRFGVDATIADATEVHVYDGIVEVTEVTLAGPATPHRLVAGQAVRTTSNAEVLTAIQADSTRFAAIMPDILQLTGTGQGLALTEVDPNWYVISIDGKPLVTPGTMTVRTAHDGLYDPPFLPNDPNTSQWLLIDQRLGQLGTGPITFTCQSRFELPPGIDPSTATLIVSFDADDSVTAVRINGNTVPVTHNEFEDDSRDLHTMTIRQHLVHGQNTIEFDVMDRRALGRATSGLRVKLALQPDQWRKKQ